MELSSCPSADAEAEEEAEDAAASEATGRGRQALLNVHVCIQQEAKCTSGQAKVDQAKVYQPSHLPADGFSEARSAA